jgi:hypothetical protein
MTAPAFITPRAHYTVEFYGNDHQRSFAENWCHAMLRSGFYIEIDDDGYIFHFDNAMDATAFRNQFRSLCGDLRSSQKPFPLTP